MHRQTLVVVSSLLVVGCSASFFPLDPAQQESTPRSAGCVLTDCNDAVQPVDVPASTDHANVASPPASGWRSPEWFSSFRAPAAAHQGACTADELRLFSETCVGATGSEADCGEFTKLHSRCIQCIATDVAAPAWGPFVIDSIGNTWLNTEGCIARVAGDEDCARKVYTANGCLSGCSSAPDRDACLVSARASECKKVVSDAESCAAKLGLGTSPAYAPCGQAVGDASDETTRTVVAFFCGAAEGALTGPSGTSATPTSPTASDRSRAP
jgi:hypothetical protein